MADMYTGWKKQQIHTDYWCEPSSIQRGRLKIILKTQSRNLLRFQHRWQGICGSGDKIPRIFNLGT